MTQHAAKLARLLEIKTTNYKAQGDMHPEVAAQFAIDYVVTLIKGQPKYADQLLDEEIEDALKAGEKIGAPAISH